MVGHTSFPDFLNYDCIIHQQALCGKILNMKEVRVVAMKIVCSIQARSLQRRLFPAHLEETSAEHTDLLLNTNVRWLSRGTFLAKLLQVNAEFAQLEDYKWLLELAFLTDLTGLLNELELQGEDNM